MSQSCQRRPCGTTSGAGGHCLRMAASSPLIKAVQNGIGGLLHRLGTNLSSCWSQQGEQFGRLASQVLVGPTRRLAFRLPGSARLRDTLVGTAFIFTPQLQAEPLGGHIRSLNERFFSCVYGSWRSSTPCFPLWRVVPV